MSKFFQRWKSQVETQIGLKGRPCIGYKILHEDGNYDIDHKMLANVSQPKNDQDATTKLYVDSFRRDLEEGLLQQRSCIDELIAGIRSFTSNLNEEYKANSDVMHQLSTDILLLSEEVKLVRDAFKI